MRENTHVQPRAKLHDHALFRGQTSLMFDAISIAYDIGHGVGRRKTQQRELDAESSSAFAALKKMRRSRERRKVEQHEKWSVPETAPFAP